MSTIDDKTPIFLDWIDKIGSDFKKMFKTKFGSMKISAKSTVLVNFCKFYFFAKGGEWIDFTPSTRIGLREHMRTMLLKVDS